MGDPEKFAHALGFKSLDSFFRVSKQGPCFTAIKEDGDDKRLVAQLELLCKADGVAPPDPVLVFSIAIAEAILIWTSAEQVPYLLRVAPR